MVRTLPSVVVFIVVCGSLSLWPIPTIDLVDIALLIVVGAVPSIVLASAPARVRRVIRIMIRAFIVVPVLLILQDLMGFIAAILRFHRVDVVMFIGEIPRVVRAAGRALAVGQPERLSIVKPMLSFSGIASTVFAITRRMRVVHRRSPGQLLRQAAFVVPDDQLTVVNAVPSPTSGTRMVLNSIIPAVVDLVFFIAGMLRARGRHPINLRLLLRASCVIQVALEHVVWSAMATFVPVIPGRAAAAVNRVCHRNDDPLRSSNATLC